MIELITANEIKQQLTFVKNLDEQMLNPYIATTIDIHLTELIGAKLVASLKNGEHEDLLPLVKNYLMWQVLSEVVIPLTFKLRNAGVVNSTGEHIQVVSMKDAEVLKSEYANKAHNYQDVLLKELQKQELICCCCSNHNFNGVSIFLN